MKREWKPGDVGMIDTRGDDALVVRLGDGYWFAVQTGTRLNPYLQPRPLAVIDPGDDKAADRLAALLWPHYAANERARLRKAEIVTNALREYADPKPPRPAEPDNLAVRVWAAGTTWARITSWWVPVALDEAPRDWDWLTECDDFLVVSDGVPS